MKTTILKSKVKQVSKSTMVEDTLFYFGCILFLSLASFIIYSVITYGTSAAIFYH